MSNPTPKHPPNRQERRARQRLTPSITPPVTQPTTTTMTSYTLSGAKVRQTATTHSASHTCAELGVCNSRTPACKANQCQQGRTACPVPQACEVADRAKSTAPHSAHQPTPITPRTGLAGLDWGHPWAPLEEPPASAKDIASALAVVACAVAAVVVIVVSLAP